MRATTLSALFFATIAAVFALLQAPADPDLFWQLQSGEWILRHGQLLDRDEWSFTRAGTPYSVGAWLGQVAMAAAYGLAGWSGIVVLRAALVGVAIFFVARLVLRHQPDLKWAALPLLGVILVSRLVWGDRPQLFTLALFPLTLDLLIAARLEGHTRRLLLLPPVFLLWSNLHNSFPIGLVAAAVVAGEALLTRSATWRPLALAFLASALVALLNPSGLGAVGRAATYAGSVAYWVVEERPLDVLTPAGVVFTALLLAALASVLASGRERTEGLIGSAWLWAGLVAPFVLLALAIQRNTPYACMLVAPVAAAVVPEALSRPGALAPAIPRAAAAVAVAACALALTAVAAIASPREPDLSAYPAGSLAALAQSRGNLLNEYDWGGYLIRYAPEHRVFIDGRGAQLFVPEVLDDFQRAVLVAPGYRDVLRRWDVSLALLKPGRALAAALREDGWQVLGSTERWVLLARP